MESQGIFQIHPKAKRFELLCRWHNSFFFYEGSIFFPRRARKEDGCTMRRAGSVVPLHAAWLARPRSARTLRDSYAPAGARVRATSGGSAPYNPRQEPEVPAPPGFFSKPCGGFSSSALRAYIARFFMCLRAHRSRATLGALPLIPRQEPEVPAPPGFYSKPCSSSALRANIARFLCACGRAGLGYIRGLRPL